METSIDNYFNIPNPQEFYCTIWRYRHYHSFLKIKLHRGSLAPLFWIIFTVPIYFKLPMAWKGANFRVANPEEQLLTWPLLATEELSKDMFLKYYRLFTAQVETDLPQLQTVQIIAMRGRLYSETDAIDQ